MVMQSAVTLLVLTNVPANQDLKEMAQNAPVSILYYFNVTFQSLFMTN